MDLLKNIKILEDEIEGKVFFGLFDKYIDFFAPSEVGLEYTKKCAEYLNAINEKVKDDLCSASIRYCNEVLKMSSKKTQKFDNLRDVLKLIYPACLGVPYPENNNESIIHLELNCSWEEEHGMEWIVRNDSVLYVGPYFGEDPWADFSVKEAGNYA